MKKSKIIYLVRCRPRYWIWCLSSFKELGVYILAELWFCCFFLFSVAAEFCPWYSKEWFIQFLNTVLIKTGFYVNWYTLHEKLRVSEISVCKQNINDVQLPGEEKQVALLRASDLSLKNRIAFTYNLGFICNWSCRKKTDFSDQMKICMWE